MIDREMVKAVLIFSENVRNMLCGDMRTILEEIDNIPSAEPETIAIEEVSNQLGCATTQSALYWFEFLKTLDSLGFAIVRKKTK